jgi:hypothetical protein
VRGLASALPFRNESFDASLAVLTINRPEPSTPPCAREIRSPRRGAGLRPG